jgi:hypothetical protein
MCGATRDVRFGPIADIASRGRPLPMRLLDYVSNCSVDLQVQSVSLKRSTQNLQLSTKNARSITPSLGQLNAHSSLKLRPVSISFGRYLSVSGSKSNDVFFGRLGSSVLSFCPMSDRASIIEQHWNVAEAQKRIFVGQLFRG